MIVNHTEHIKTLFQHCQVHKIFGTAGSGKTTFLINELHKLFESGVEPKEVAFVSFTNRAVNEITERCIEQFQEFNKENFLHFRTIHSMCYKTITREEKTVITQKELIQLAAGMGLQVSTFQCIEDGMGNKQGDKVINIESLSRLKMITLEDQWRQSNEKDCPLFIVKEWHKKLQKYKEENQLMDFTDMLEYYNSSLSVKYIFIDEAQDLCPLQWEIMHRASKNCIEVFIAGDDDQSIFNWAGAIVDYFLDIKTDKETILRQSFRLPKIIYNLSRKILKRIHKRKEKECDPIDKTGKIYVLSYLHNLKLEKTKNYLILVRNRWQIKDIVEYLRNLGHIYFLFDKNSFDCDELLVIKLWLNLQKNKESIEKNEYRKIQKYSAILQKYKTIEDIPKNILNRDWDQIFNLIDSELLKYFKRALINNSIGDLPNIKVSTIHQAKGGEENNVILLTDVSYNVWNNIKTDNEHKVWYVAITRAKENLYIIREQTSKYYQI